MKKLLLILPLLLLGCAAPQAQALTNNTEYLASTVTTVPTQTAIPSATIGYEATLQMAQATADEARRVNAQVTAEFEQRAQEQLRMTQQADIQYWQIQSWTATVAATAIPLTATQQVISNTQVARQQEIIAAQLTSTHEAPTRAVIMAQVENQIKYGKVEAMARVFAMLGVGAFCIGLVVFFARFPVVEKPEAMEQPSGVQITLKHDHGQGFGKTEKVTVPCNEEQLTELSELAANGEKRFAINRLETTSRTFRNQRATLLAVRQFMIDNEFMIANGDGATTLNDDGAAFLEAWFESRTLPTEYQIAEEQTA